MGLTTDRNDPGLGQIRLDGQQEMYLVLEEEERKKGFVRPLRKQYKHVACGTITTIPLAIAETYAKDPKFYNGTFCVHCKKHFYLLDDKGQPNFLWDDGQAVGS